MNFFKVLPEKQISSSDMNLSYLGGGKSVFTYDYEYPKLIINKDDNPLIAFVDEKSAKLYLADFSGQNVRFLYSQPSHDEKSEWRWPIIFEKDNKLYFAIFSEDVPWLRTQRIKVYLFDQDSKKLNLEEDKVFNLSQGCELWGVYPYNSKIMFIGRCDYFALRDIPSRMFSAVPTFYHNASFLFDSKDSKKWLTRQSIEEPGRYNVYNQVYDVSTSGAIQAAWVRNTTTVGTKHDEIIYLSTNKNGTSWSSPIELYSVKNVGLINGHISDHINNLSLASYGNTSFVLWKDREKGIFFSELNNGKNIEHTQISHDLDVIVSSNFPKASTIKIAADSSGNVYTLWLENGRNDYKLHFRARIGKQWTPEDIINEGRGSAYLPDMKVDQEGNIHIIYIKLVNPHEVRKTLGDNKYGCFYMKLERQDKR
ncbi:MAG: hypothetical protein LLG40_02275 [Deltaproteobacteria bacterium]|nr:hypothetical protein [Deltaproteobacteria bacterium]